MGTNCADSIEVSTSGQMVLIILIKLETKKISTGHRQTDVIDAATICGSAETILKVESKTTFLK